MTTYEALALVLSAAIIALVSAIIWARWETRLRITAFFAFFAIVPLPTAVVIAALSWPGLAWTVQGGDHPVIGVKLVQDEGIYIWLDTDENPRSLRLPWDNALANELQDMIDAETQGESGGFLMHIPELWELEETYQFSEVPPPPQAPPKDPGEEPLRYEWDA